MIAILLITVACQPKITSFEECIASGNPTMESYPRQCRANGQTFTEVIEQPTQITNDFHECSVEEKAQTACTRKYDPVCAIIDNNIRCITEPCASTDAKTASTGCTACADHAIGYYPVPCKDYTFIVCTENINGFDPEKYAMENNGICVDICPGNYDSYIAQVGFKICIERYGEDEISEWQICTQSSDRCICAKAYESTIGDEIRDPKYRCVPDRYAERLLFRSGLDILDKEGKQSIMIA